MKKVLGLILAISLVLSVFVAMPVSAVEVDEGWVYGEEIIANGDFEDLTGDIPTGWGFRDVWGGGYDPYVEYAEDRGNYAYSPGAAGTVSQDIVLKEGEVAYLISGEYKAEINNQASITVTYLTADETYSTAWSKLLPAATEWTEFNEVVYLAEDSAHTATASLFLYNRDGEGLEACWDNISMREITNYELPPYGDNIFTNGDFEDCPGDIPTGWGARDVWGGGYVPTAEYDDVRGFYMHSPGAAGTISQSITLKEGEVAYLLEFDYKAEIDDQASININSLINETWTGVWSALLPAAADWTRYSEVIYLKDKGQSSQADVFFYNRAGDGNVVCWDNISLREIRNYEPPALTYGPNVVPTATSKFNTGHGWTIFNVWDRVTPESQPSIVTDEDGNSYFYSTVGCGYATIELTGIDTAKDETVYLLEYDYMLADGVQATAGFNYLYHAKDGTGSAWVGQTASNNNLPASPDDWTHFSIFVYINNDLGNRNGRFSFQFYNQGGVMFKLDNVSLREVTGYDTDNMMPNYSFEAGAGNALSGYGYGTLAGAVERPDTMPTITAEDSSHGDKALYQKGWGGHFWADVAIPTGTSGTYILEYDYKQTEANHIWCNVYDNAATKVTYVDELDTVVSDDWTRARRVIKLDNYQGTVLKVVMTGRVSDTAELWVDNMSLKPVSKTDVIVDEAAKTAIGSYVNDAEGAKATFVFASYTTNAAGAKVLTDVKVANLANGEAASFKLTNAGADDEVKAYLWEAGKLTPVALVEAE